MHMRRWVRAGALGLAMVALLAGCSGVKKSIDRINASAAAYTGLQSFIQSELTTKFHRSVRSVSCTPHVDQVLQDDQDTFRCLVRFTDGSSYISQGTVIDPSNDPDMIYYRYRFTNPPVADITTAPLPAPAVALAATSRASLLAARNLAPVIRRLHARFAHGLIIQLAIYPGELEAVIGGSGQAQAVSVTYSGVLTTGPAVSFAGSRSGIDFSQLSAGVIQRLARQIETKGGVRAAAIDRFVLTNSLPDHDSGWNIYLTSGPVRFQALVLGDHLVKITPAGRHAVS
jgi:hypothetical protein